jgi:hypothetical protein
MPKTSVKKNPSKGSSSLKKSVTSNKSKSTAGKALSQRKVNYVTVLPITAKEASGILKSKQSNSKSKSVAGSALTQVRNPRSGHFVKIDSVTGRIISHKKSDGTYKDVPIVRNSRLK